MLQTKRIQAIGGSLGVILDKDLLAAAGLKKGDLVEIYFRVPAGVKIVKGKKVKK